MRPKIKLFAVKFRCILEVFAWRVLWRKFWAHFHDLYVQKWSCFLLSSDAFRRFSPCVVYNRSSGCIMTITIFASTNEAVCHEVQTDFGSFLRASFIKKLWVHFFDFSVQKWSYLLLSSDAIWKLWLCQVYEESFGRIFMIYASKNEAVCCEVQMYFGSSPYLRFTRRFLGAFSRFLRPKTKQFAVKFRRILEAFPVQAS